ncbi:Metallo-dependent phosphatase [Patellaria atrata CBS 101060]|uniref:Metallo-dependent phosphatase n=1 Tax=Patellaria atrata CBS 101060 TaxID=1346257 RepID=A0A9P4VQQ1_9PEZI|nr:Metallo-dependent phosphatase [Patellaria atrata CBS 101060]
MITGEPVADMASSGADISLTQPLTPFYPLSPSHDERPTGILSSRRTSASDNSTPSTTPRIRPHAPSSAPPLSIHQLNPSAPLPSRRSVESTASSTTLVSPTFESHYMADTRPLIEKVTNEWKSGAKYKDHDAYDDSFNFSDKELAMSVSPILRAARIPRRIQRYLFVYLVLALGLFAGWRFVVRPSWEEHIALEKTFVAQPKKGIFGSNQRPQFSDMIQVKALDSSLLPSTGEKERLVFVGDVHGCKDELVKLLEKISFRPASDHLILTGDIIAKGPDSTGVVDLVSSMSASCVRGNHEDRMLLAWKDINSMHAPLAGPNEAENSQDDFMDEESFSHGDYKERKLAKQFTKRQIDWIQQCPVILKVGEIEGMGEVVVVHAGLVPGVDLERQDPFQAMNMRTIDLETRVPSEERNGKPWEKLWNYYQKRQPESARSTVIYGHDAKRGLNIKKFSKGLDSGCVKGGKLSALVVEGGAKGTPATQTLVQVRCQDHTGGK